MSWAEDNIDASRILAYAPKEHAASLNVMRKCGMRFVQTATIRGVSCEVYEYRL